MIDLCALTPAQLRKLCAGASSELARRHDDLRSRLKSIAREEGCEVDVKIIGKRKGARLESTDELLLRLDEIAESEGFVVHCTFQRRNHK